MTLRLIDMPSPNFNERQHPLDMLVMHYTGMQSGAAALSRLVEPDGKVSAHYMVEEDGTVFRLVPEDKRAWQAGKSWWQGDEDLNSRSIGIEIVNPGHEWGYRPFTAEQMDAVLELAQGILSRWPIPKSRVVAHSDIAPDRKEDPGELFPWRRFAEAGVGLWPDAQGGGGGSISHGFAPDERGDRVKDLQRDLAAIGYRQDVTGELDEWTRAVIRAFQRHWRPEVVTGEPDLATLMLVGRMATLVRAERR